MNALMLLRNETIKSTRRVAVWVTLLAFSTITGLMLADQHMSSIRERAPRPFVLPDAWWVIIEEPLQVASFFGAVILILLIASEFSWRTARQNVIDGLSKEEFFVGKLLLVPLTALVFFTIVAVAGPLVAMLGEGLPQNGWISPDQVRFAGGATLCMLGFASLALLFATSIRSAGSALGAFILYVAFAERIIALLLGVMRREWRGAGAYLPTNVFNALMDPSQWSLALRAAEVRPDRPPRDFADTGTLVALALCYCAIFIITSFLSFRRRDL